jgi:apolipoprotein N-acyltransferase
MVAGDGAHVLQATLPATVRGGRRLPIGVLICFESAFPDMSRYDADHGAQVIIYQTSDWTFQGSWALAQHASLSALRAAETGRPVVQAALTGDSAAFDSRGRVLAWKGGADRGVVLVTLRLPPASARTPFDRLGDFVPLTAVVIVALALAFGLVRGGLPGRVRRGMGRPHRPARIRLRGSRAPEGHAPAPCVPPGEPDEAGPRPAPPSAPSLGGPP